MDRIHRRRLRAGNPGPAGWGAVLIAPASGGESDHFGFIGPGTNQIAELTAAIEGLARVPAGAAVAARLRQPVRAQGPHRVARRLGAQGLAQLEGRAGGEPRPVEAAVRAAPMRARSTVRWVKGHNGDRCNEKADALANKALALRPAASSATA